MQWLAQRLCFSKHQCESALLTVLSVGTWAWPSVSPLPSSGSWGSAAGRQRRPSTYHQEFLVNMPRHAITQLWFCASRCRTPARRRHGVLQRYSHSTQVGECEANVNEQAANAIEDAKPRSTAYLTSRNSNLFRAGAALSRCSGLSDRLQVIRYAL
jgi:hypothetical protein